MALSTRARLKFAKGVSKKWIWWSSEARYDVKAERDNRLDISMRRSMDKGSGENWGPFGDELPAAIRMDKSVKLALRTRTPLGGLITTNSLLFINNAQGDFFQG